MLKVINYKMFRKSFYIIKVKKFTTISSFSVIYVNIVNFLALLNYITN